jgi:cystathionine gamma-synthase
VRSEFRPCAGVPGQEHLPPTLLRRSVGIEAVEDLWNDLDRALRSVPEV